MTLIEGHLALDPPSGVPVWDIDPYDEAILAAPEAFYADLRAIGPFAYIPKYAILACGRYGEVKEVFGDHDRFVSSRGVGLVDFEQADPWRPPSIILEVDPPEHTRVRRILSRALSPKVMREGADMFATTAKHMVADVMAKGRFDAVEDLAERYPTTVFPQIVGLNEITPSALLDYGAMVFDSVGPDNTVRRNSLAKAASIVPEIMAQCQRQNLAEGGIGLAIYAHADAGEISEQEAGLLVRSLLSAGVDTTVTGIGNLLYCLAANPDQWAALKADPKLARPAFEEVLRFTAPVHSFYRTAGVDTEVSGIAIQKGSKILCALGAANRDDARFAQADRFDISRAVQGHLGMGVGIHGCVGQNLARAEVAAVLSEIIAQVDEITFDGDPVWRPGNSIRALSHLPLHFS